MACGGADHADLLVFVGDQPVGDGAQGACQAFSPTGAGPYKKTNSWLLPKTSRGRLHKWKFVAL